MDGIGKQLEEIKRTMGELSSRPGDRARVPTDDPTFRKLYRELMRSFYKARRGKRNTVDESSFEENLVANIYRLALDIYFGVYEPSAGIAFVNKPLNGVQREIYAAPFRDRVVHHYVFDKTNPWWDERLISDSTSCRKGKGTLYAISRAQEHLREASDNFKKEVVVYRGDIQGFFMSMDRQLILERARWGLERQYHNRKASTEYQILDFLWEKILLQDPTVTVRYRGQKSDWDVLPKSKILSEQLPGRGIVIGNLTSQLISNIFLDQLDRYITKQLGYKYYGRYVDDFYIIVEKDKLKQLQRDLELIKTHMEEELKLRLHPDKCKIIYNINKEGMAFLGVIIYPRRIILGKKFKKNFGIAIERFLAGECSIEVVWSYEALAIHFNAYKLVEKMYKRYGLDPKWRLAEQLNWQNRQFKGRKTPHWIKSMKKRAELLYMLDFLEKMRDNESLRETEAECGIVQSMEDNAGAL